MSRKQTTVSLGQHATHTLDQMIRAAAQHGFADLELVYSDLSAYAETNGLSMSTAAEDIRELCAKNNVAVISLAPFENFDGSSMPLEKRLEIARHWIGIATKLGALYLQIPSHYKADESAGDETTRISDLQKLADIGSAEQPVVSIAYEALSWGIHYSTWEDSLYVVEKVNRPNFGLCLDNFHVITKLWASAFEPSGKKGFRDHCPLDKIFYLQFSDGELFDPPSQTNNRGIWKARRRSLPGRSMLVRFRWSRNWVGICLLWMLLERVLLSLGLRGGCCWRSLIGGCGMSVFGLSLLQREGGSRGRS